MKTVWKKLSDLKLSEVFEWPRLGGQWKVQDVLRKENRSRDGHSVTFWFTRQGSSECICFVKGIDKDELVEVSEARD